MAIVMKSDAEYSVIPDKAIRDNYTSRIAHGVRECVRYFGVKRVPCPAELRQLYLTRANILILSAIPQSSGCSSCGVLPCSLSSEVVPGPLFDGCPYSPELRFGDPDAPAAVAQEALEQLTQEGITEVSGSLYSLRSGADRLREVDCQILRAAGLLAELEYRRCRHPLTPDDEVVGLLDRLFATGGGNWTDHFIPGQPARGAVKRLLNTGCVEKRGGLDDWKSFRVRDAEAARAYLDRLLNGVQPR